MICAQGSAAASEMASRIDTIHSTAARIWWSLSLARSKATRSELLGLRTTPCVQRMSHFCPCTPHQFALSVAWDSDHLATDLSVDQGDLTAIRNRASGKIARTKA